MKTNRSTRWTLGLAMIAVAISPVLATERPFSAFIDGPLVIGDQAFSGGAVQLVPVGRSSQLTAVRLDGRQVALFFTESAAHRSDIARDPKSLVLTKDEHGFYRMVGLTFESDRHGTTLRPFRLASVAPGLALTTTTTQTVPATATR